METKIPNWIHCNKCKTFKFNSSLKCAVGECGHLICTKCIKESNSASCALCGSLVQFVVIQDEDLPEEIQKILTPASTQFEELKSLNQFQQENALDLIEFLKSTTTHYRKKCLEFESELKATKE
jgi:hypothetical protein